MYVPHDVRHVEFSGLTGSQRTPRFWGVTVATSQLPFFWLQVVPVALNIVATLISGFGVSLGRDLSNWF